MARKATPQELRTLLREKTAEIRRSVGDPEAQLSIPTDGKGLRILAVLRKVPNVPSTVITVRLANEDLEVSVELLSDFELFQILH